MAKIISISRGKNTIDVIISGTIGNKIWVNRNGKNYTRSKPTKVSNPKTPAQLEHRAKFKAMIRFLKPLSLFLKVGFKNESATMSSFNAAMSYNYKMALTGTYSDFDIDYSKVLLSCGALPGALNPKVRIRTTNEIEFTWEDNSNVKQAKAEDKVLLVIYNTSKCQAVTIMGGNTRKSGGQVMTLPLTFQGDEVQCYIAFQNDNQSAISDSLYAGNIRM